MIVLAKVLSVAFILYWLAMLVANLVEENEGLQLAPPEIKLRRNLAEENK